MVEQLYTTESKVWRLYKRIEDATKEQLAKGSYSMPGSDPLIDDIIISGAGIKLIGRCGCSGLVYKWYEEIDWARASFKPELQVPRTIHKGLLKILESHYGKPTSEGSEMLIYQIIVGERKITETFHDNNKVNEKTENITKILILDIAPSSFLTEPQRKEVARQKDKHP